MAKTNSSFNLSKSAKRIAGTFVNKEQRRNYLNAMIDAEHSYIAGKSRKFSDPATAQRGGNRPAPAQETQS